MDLSTTVIFSILFLAIWVKLSAFSFIFCLCLSCIAVCMLIYLLVFTETVLPIEQLLLHQFVKDFEHENINANENAEANKINPNYDDEISRKLRELIGHIVRDFILDWYNTVSDDVNFVQEAFELFEYIFTEVRQRVSVIDSNQLALILLCRLTHHYSCYKKALECAGPNQHDSQRLDQLIVVSYEKLHGHLAMSNPPDTEKDHIRSIVAVLLKGLLPEDYNLNGCAFYIVRELISQNVFGPFIDMLGDPHWINTVIPRILEDDVTVDDNGSKSDDLSDRGSDTSGESQTGVVTDEDNTRANETAAETSAKTPTDVFKFFDNIPDLNVRFSTVESTVNKHNVQLSDETQTTNQTEPGPSVHCEHNSTVMSGSLPSTSSEAELGESLPMAANHSHFASSKIDTSYTHQFVSSKLLRTTEEASSQKFSTQEKSLFQRIRIPEAINIEETFEGGTKYTLYKIKYYAPPVKEGRSNAVTDTQLEEFQVQRRFREFLTLQDSLNDNKLIRKIITKIKGPSRMFPMPIGNMDKEYIEKRRKFLQAYIRELCYYPEVAKSPELCEFFAYNSDPRIAYVRRPTEYIPRFDKMLKNVFQELIGSASSKINETFQNDHSEKLLLSDDSMTATTSEPMPVPIPQSNTVSQNNPTDPPINFSQQSKMRGPVTMLKSIVYGKTTDLSVYENGLRDYQPFGGPKTASEMTFGWKLPGAILQDRVRSRTPHSGARRTRADGCDSTSDNIEVAPANLHQYAIPGQIFNLAYHVWGIKLGIHTLSFLASARFVKEFVAIKLRQLTRKEMWVHYLQILQQSLWPGGKWENEINEISNDPELNRAKAQKALEEAFPGVLKHVVGEMEYSIGVKELLDSFQNPNVNRHLVFHLIDILLQILFPDLQNIIHNRSNITL